MHHPTDRIAHTTAFVTPVVEHWLEREIYQWGRTGMRKRIYTWCEKWTNTTFTKCCCWYAYLFPCTSLPVSRSPLWAGWCWSSTWARRCLDWSWSSSAHHTLLGAQSGGQGLTAPAPSGHLVRDRENNMLKQDFTSPSLSGNLVRDREKYQGICIS